MRHLLQLKKSLPLLVLGAVCAVNPVFAESTEAQDHAAHHAADISAWLGTYQGLLPCTDCPGLKTTLSINKNETYMIMTVFLGKSEREFVEKGKIEWVGNDKIKTVPKNDKPSQMYQLVDGNVYQLDAQGNRVTGKLAEKYILRRFDITQQTGGSSNHSGH